MTIRKNLTHILGFSEKKGLNVQNDNQEQLKPIEILKVGTFTPMKGNPVSFTQDDLEHIASSYDPAKFEAPLVIGHPKTNNPAYGWISRLYTKGDTLLAEVRDLAPEMAELIKGKHYKKISASLYSPDSPNYPVTDGKHYYLKHVGLLGAEAPAVKGLASVGFADDEAGILFFSDTLEPFDSLEFSQMREKADKYEILLAEQRRENHISFIDRMVKEGRLLPFFQEGVLEFMETLDRETTFEFSEHQDRKTSNALDWFRSFLSKTPPVVPMGANHREHDADFAEKQDSGFVVPKGYQVDTVRADLHERATAYAKHHDVSFTEALKRIDA